MIRSLNKYWCAVWIFLLVLFSAPTLATNQLGWNSTQASVWANLNSTNHAMWVRLKSKADGLPYGDVGLYDALVYLITGDVNYANSAYVTLIKNYRGRTYNTGGISPDRDSTRHQYGTYVLMYSWIADAISPTNKANFRDVLDHWSDLVFSASHGTRTNDSDEMVGHYFGLVMHAMAIRDEDLATSNALLNATPASWTPVGGLDATATDRSTWRNTISEYVIDRAAGGQWLESSEYNLTTARYLIEYSHIISEFWGSDKFPEITAWVPQAEAALINEMTPDFLDSYEWGDEQGPHNIGIFHRAGLLSVIASITGNPNTYDLYDVIYSYTGSSSLWPHYLPYLDPSKPRSKISGQTSLNAHGRGVAYHHTGWNNNDSFFGSYVQNKTGVDHETGAAGNFALYRNGAWAVDAPRGYQLHSSYYNTMLISGGLDTAAEARGQSGYAAGNNYLYHVGTTGGQFVWSFYWDPPDETLHEWTRSNLYLHNADGSDSIVVFDRINSSNPQTDLTAQNFGRFTSSAIRDINNAAAAHQWVIHLPNATPTINGNAIEWTSAGSETVYLRSFLSSPYTTAVYDESALQGANGNPYIGGTIHPTEPKYQLRLMPTQKKGHQTLLNVIHAGGTVVTTEYGASVGENARAVLIQNTSDSALAVFNGDVGSLPFTANGNPVAIQPSPESGGRSAHDPNRFNLQKQLRFFTSGFTLTTTTATATTAYLADLDPGLSWTIQLNGAAQAVTPNSAGLAIVAMPTSGSNTLVVASGAPPPNNPPIASVNGPYTGTVGVPVPFSSAGTSDPDGDTLTYAWDFGDTATSTAANPSHTYSSTGPFTVSLTVDDGNGGSDNAQTTATISVNNPPIASVNGPYTGMVGVPVSFSSAGTSDPDGHTLTYAWDFGDTGTSTAANPSHTYSSTGPFTVSLTVDDGNGGSDNAQTTATISVNNPPIASVNGPYTGTVGVPVSFSSAGTSDPDGDTLTYAWDFGDTFTSTAANPSHTYISTGPFTVSLTVDDGNGGSDNAQTTATISAAVPRGSFTDAFENLLVDHAFRGMLFSATAPVNLYVSLHVMSCTDALPGTEVSAGGYARAAIPRSQAAWNGTHGTNSGLSVGTNGTISNNQAILFGSPSADWGMIYSFGINSALTGGVQYVCEDLTVPRSVNNGMSGPRFPANSLTIQVDG